MAGSGERIALIGAGMIGRGWVVAFARARMPVAVWSRSQDNVRGTRAYVAEALRSLQAEGLLEGDNPDDLAALVTACSSLEHALDGATYVQENLSEDLALKRAVFAQLDQLSHPEAILASSTSALLPSAFTEHLRGRARCIVAHPINPPYLIPATEVVPAPWTDPRVVERTCSILEAAGQVPVVLLRELDGFVVNRLQGALLNEAFWLVANGYAGVEDVDTAIKHGLALRWSFMGPFETIDLNSPRGVREYAERYDPLYQRLHAQMRDRASWVGPVIDTVEPARRSRLPAGQLEARQAWRDRRLMALAAHKRAADARIGR